MPVFQYLDLSTAHMTEADSRILETAAEIGVRVILHDYGWWIHVPEAGSEAEEADTEMKAAGMSDAFRAVIDSARYRGCRWVNFDQDADEDDDLPVSEW